MILKSVFSKCASARGVRNFSSRRRQSGGRGFCSSRSLSDEDTKTILPLWRKMFEVGKKTACGGLGIASGYELAKAILPDHSEPFIEEEKITRDLMKRYEEYMAELDEMMKKLEEEAH